MIGYYPKKFKESVHKFLSQPEQTKLLRNNDLDTLFGKMYASEDLNGIAGIAYVTELLYDNGFLVEKYVINAYQAQFRHIDREIIYLPKCKSIDHFSFAHNEHVKEVIAPNVTFVGAFAFEDCENLHRVDLSNATSISKTAFERCESLAADNIKTPRDCNWF